MGRAPGTSPVLAAQPPALVNLAGHRSPLVCCRTPAHLKVCLRTHPVELIPCAVAYWAAAALSILATCQPHPGQQCRDCVGVGSCSRHAAGACAVSAAGGLPLVVLPACLLVHRAHVHRNRSTGSSCLPLLVVLPASTHVCKGRTVRECMLMSAWLLYVAGVCTPCWCWTLCRLVFNMLLQVCLLWGLCKGCGLALTCLHASVWALMLLGYALEADSRDPSRQRSTCSATCVLWQPLTHNQTAPHAYVAALQHQSRAWLGRRPCTREGPAQ